MENLLKIAEEVLEVPVTKETSLSNCEKRDSLRHVHLVIALEKAYNISFEPEEITEMKSMAEIEKKLHKKNVK